jgi:hypothetical protein
MHVNAKIHAENVPAIGEGEMKKTSGEVYSSMIYLVRCKNFCKCHNVSPSSTTIKKRKEFCRI